MNCEYYPCHDLKDMSCQWCYCPFYVYCSNLDEEALKVLKKEVGINGYWLERPGKKPVFACEKCTFPHRPEVAQFIYSKLLNAAASTFARFCKNE